MKVPDTKENRQVCIMRKKVDGIRDKVIYEFFGDYWHGNPKKFNLRDVNNHIHKTFGQLHKETFARLSKLKQKGYTIQYVWEQDWNAWCKNKSIPLVVNVF